MAQDNRLNSEWRTQKGLRLIASCDKERGKEIKAATQNYVSKGSERDPKTVLVTLQLKELVWKAKRWTMKECTAPSECHSDEMSALSAFE